MPYYIRLCPAFTTASSAELIGIGAMILRRQLVGIVFMAMALVMTCTLQVTGKTISATVLSLCRHGIMLVPMLAILSACFGLTGVLSAQAATDMFTAIPAVVLFCRGLRKELFA